MKVLHVVGARPNFMKAAPVHAALRRRRVKQFIVHTGQHYDDAMSGLFFRQLGLPAPDLNLEVGSGAHGEQTAKVMLGLEPVLRERKPDWVLVYGDVNSTVAAALVAVKLRLRVAHVEAGLRSRDREMPEEHNRIVTDHLADLLLTPSADADANLRAEGIPALRIRRVGNVMIDTLRRMLPAAKELADVGVEVPEGPFALVTMHRPSNVDDFRFLNGLLDRLATLSMRVPVLFPMHPRTRERLNGRPLKGIRVTEPLGYLQFLSLQARAAVVITDSGGIQEETTALHIPCITVRANTERPITVTLGTNVLIGDRLDRVAALVEKARAGRWKRGRVPPLWDGRAAERVANALAG